MGALESGMGNTLKASVMEDCWYSIVEASTTIVERIVGATTNKQSGKRVLKREKSIMLFLFLLLA
jgi:hypothetical protein